MLFRWETKGQHSLLMSSKGLTPEEDIIKSRLISALPSNIQAALIGHDKERLDSFSRIADSMLAVARNSSHPYHVAVQAEEREYVPKSFSRFSDRRQFTSEKRVFKVKYSTILY